LGKHFAWTAGKRFDVQADTTGATLTAETSSSESAGPTGTPSAATKTVRQGFLARLVDPLNRLVEGIYSVLIVLTFTLAARAVGSYDGVVELDDWDLAIKLFIAAGGCALAWGLIDGAMYLLTCVFERGEDLRLYRLIRTAPSEAAGVAMLAEELDDELGRLVDEAERPQIYTSLYHRLRSSPPLRAGFKKADIGGALGMFLVAITAAIPVLLPLLLVPASIEVRVRVSNLVAAGMLFAMGYSWGKYAGGKPFFTGLLLLILGLIMVLVAIPLGG
jgi:hypothetical protein